MEPISSVIVAKKVAQEVAKKSVQEVGKKATNEISKGMGKKVGKEVVHSSVDTLAEESEVSVLKGSTRTTGGLRKIMSNPASKDLSNVGRIGDSQNLRRNMVKSGLENIPNTIVFQMDHQNLKNLILL